MARRERRRPTKVEILAWALNKLADDDYHFTPEGPDGGWELNIWEQEPQEEKPLNKEERRALQVLAEKMLTDPSVASRVAEALGVEPDDARRAFLQSPIFAQYFGRLFVRWRQRVATREEANADWSAPDGSNSIVAHVLADLASSFGKIVGRTNELCPLGTDIAAPTEVQQYMEEASNCYIRGHFLACLLVCRATIERALNDFLRREGKEAELQKLRSEQGEGLLKGLIALARKLGKWSLNPALDDADEIRRKANAAAHDAAPPPEVSKEMFIKTRGVVKELYSWPGALRI